MNMIKKITSSSRETTKLGRLFAAGLKDKDVVIFSGALGAGKTTFIKGILKGLGYRRRVLSPSFTLVRQYKTAGYKVYHVDLYRLNRGSDIYNLGVEDFMYRSGTITLVEWGEKMELMLDSYIKIDFFYLKENERKIKFTFKGKNEQQFKSILENEYISH